MGRAKRLRIAELERQRLERLAAGEITPAPAPKAHLSPMAWVCCNKCLHTMPVYMANEHLAKCQPKGVTCGKCKKLILDPDFVAHMMDCEGQPKEVKGLVVKERDIDMKPDEERTSDRWAETPEPCPFNGRVTCHINKDDRRCDECWAKPKEEPKPAISVDIAEPL